MVSANKKGRRDNKGDAIYRRFITTRNGRVLDAHDYGLKAFRIPLRGWKPTKKS